MIVSLIALFVALSGTAYAVANLPKRSVGSLQLKRGAVHKENIAAGAVTAAKLAKGLVSAAPAGPNAPVTVTQEPPASFKAGWADRAGNADRATHADRARAATSADSASVAAGAASAAIAADAAKLGGHDPSFFLSRNTIVDLPRFDLTDGGERAIVLGSFTYLARCNMDVAGSDVADVVIRSSRNNSAFDGDQITANLLSSAPASARRYLRLEGPTGEPRFFAQNDGTAVAPGGGEVRSTVWYAGLNLFNTSGRCYFGGFAIV
jgi:hypothetical protein